MKPRKYSTKPHVLEVESDASKDPVINVQPLEQLVRVEHDVSREEKTSTTSDDDVQRLGVRDEDANDARRLSQNEARISHVTFSRVKTNAGEGRSSSKRDSPRRREDRQRGKDLRAKKKHVERIE